MFLSTQVVRNTSAIGSSGPQSVRYITIDGTAIGGDADTNAGDFVAANGLLSFSQDDQFKVIEVVLNDDQELEAYFETFSVGLYMSRGNGRYFGPLDLAEVELFDYGKWSSNRQ